MRWWPRDWWPCHVTPESKQAVTEAARKLDEARRRDPEIQRVASSLEAMRERNQFGPMIEEAFRRHR